MTRRIAILGHGSIGKRHARNFLGLGCVVDTYDPLDQPVHLRTQIIEAADAVVIATPSHHHLSDMIDCVAANKPMFVEKPLALHQIGRADLDLILPHIVMVGYNLRFHSCVLKAEEWLPEIGTPYWARFTCAQKNTKYGDPVIFNWSHEIDLAIELLGKADPLAVVADHKIADIILNHRVSGCQTVVHLDYVTEKEMRGFMIQGSHGALYCDLPSRMLAMEQKGGTGRSFACTGSYDDDYKDEALAFLGKLDGEENVIGCTGQEALDVLKICTYGSR